MLVSESFPTFLWNSILCILGNLLYMATRIEGHGSTGSEERLYPLSKRCGRGSILTVCVASPLQKDMATFTSSVGMPLRPQLSIACATLLQEHPDITPSDTSSGGTWEHPALTVTFGHFCVQCASPVPWGTPSKEVCTWRPTHSSCAGMPFSL